MTLIAEWRWCTIGSRVDACQAPEENVFTTVYYLCMLKILINLICLYTCRQKL